MSRRSLRGASHLSEKRNNSNLAEEGGLTSLKNTVIWRKLLLETESSGGGSLGQVGPHYLLMILILSRSALSDRLLMLFIDDIILWIPVFDKKGRYAKTWTYFRQILIRVFVKKGRFVDFLGIRNP